MARPRGFAKTGGRQKGTPNNRTLILKDALDQLGHDLPTKITDLIPQLPPEKQVDIYMDLLEYVFPKRKAIEFSGPDGGSIKFEEDREQLVHIFLDDKARKAAEILAERLAVNVPDPE